MNLFDIPGLNGYKTALGSWGLMLVGIAGVLATVATAVSAIGQLLSGALPVQAFVQQVGPLFLSLGSMFGGLTALGIGHKIVKITPAATDTTIVTDTQP